MSLLNGRPENADDRPAYVPEVFAQTVAGIEQRGPSGSRFGIRAGLLEACSNPRCRSGWLHVWRSRSTPVFESGWTCSPVCTEKRIQLAIRREMDGRGTEAGTYRHRMPLGLVMMEQGWITPQQLKQGLEAQRTAGGGRLGQFLVAQHGISEHLVTKALSLQWKCPVLGVDFHDPEALSPLMPRLFVDAFGALPLRVAARRLLYLGFEQRLDPVLALAVERMIGLRVESGIVCASEFGPARERMLNAVYPPVQLLEAASEPTLVSVLAKIVERTRPVESRLVRLHDCLWLRMWTRKSARPLPDTQSVQDVIASTGQ